MKRDGVALFRGLRSNRRCFQFGGIMGASSRGLLILDRLRRFKLLPQTIGCCNEAKGFEVRKMVDGGFRSTSPAKFIFDSDNNPGVLYLHGMFAVFAAVFLSWGSSHERE